MLVYAAFTRRRMQLLHQYHVEDTALSGVADAVAYRVLVACFQLVGQVCSIPLF